MLTRTWPQRLALAAALASTVSMAGAAGTRGNAPGDHAFRLPDHYEFDASLVAAFRADPQGRHALRLAFDYPAGGANTQATWQVDVLDQRGVPVQRYLGEAPLSGGRGLARLAFDGRHASGPALAAGFYTLRLRAVPSLRAVADAGKPLAERAAQAFALAREELVDQRVDILVGNVAKPRMPAFKALPHGGDDRTAVAAGSLPYTIYYGNLHSQTNHSDGGTPVGSCGGSEVPQGGSMGPAEAYAMMDEQAGGDFLLTSEHNHMYDGSTSTNTSAHPATANNMFASGLSAAASYRSAHPDFLALYGNEWGVISNGGHLNILNPDALPSWEYNGSNQLIGGVATIKSNYADLYATMKARGWIGQFNHPSTSGQFQINGTALAYDANGAEVMVAAEIRNTSAFSTNTTEGETGGGSFGGAFNILLERGYHVAPTSNQDNHCANWGIAGRNRTGVLLPNGAALTVANFLDAMKARRGFATEDKNAQVVLTGNGQVMGQSIASNGALTLAANYASTSGGTAQRVQFFEGVPGRNGTVTQLFEGAGTYSFTPSEGEHFYYVLVTEADGDRLWSAPIWVSQASAPPADTTPPTVSASESGTSGTITLSASASDNVGVSKVEFYVDGVLKGADSSSPYAMTMDSRTLSDGAHALTAKAYDAAGLSATSAPVSFSISNVIVEPPSTQFNEAESNGSIAAANTVAHSYKTIVGTMGNSTDKDYFKLSLAANETVKIDMAGGPAGADYDLYLVNGSDGTLKSSTGGTVTETLSYTNGASAATVYAKVIPYSGSSSSAAYTLTLAYTPGTTPPPATELFGNPGFESGNTAWTATSGVIDNSSSQSPRTGSWKAWLNGYGSAHTDTLRQTVTIPSTATGTFSFWLKVVSSETSTTTAYDTLKVQVRNSSGTVLTTLATYSNLNKGSSYVQKSFSLAAYKGQTVQIHFEGVEGSNTATSFLIDDASLK